MKWGQEHQAYARYSLLWLLAYAFLLRVPSEALPAVGGKGDYQSALFLDGDSIILELKRRKNKPGGSRLVRTCWCKESRASVLFDSYESSESH